MQEHLNLALEDAVQRSGSEWDGKLIRDVISRNVHYFVDLKNGWGQSVGLAKRKGYHPEPHSKPEVSTLLRVYKETHLHRFMAVRSYTSSSSTADTYRAGVVSLQAGRLEKWIIESTRGRNLRNATPAAIAELQTQIDEDVQDTADEDDADLDSTELPPAQDRRGNVQFVDSELVIELEDTNVQDIIEYGEDELDEEGLRLGVSEIGESETANDGYFDEVDEV